MVRTQPDNWMMIFLLSCFRCQDADPDTHPTVSSLTWLENHLFLAIHTATNLSPPSSIYHIITRQPPSSFIFQKLADPVGLFGSDSPPHYTILRLRDFPPNLQDLLIVSSTTSTDIGLLSRSKTALASDKSSASITGVFTTTELLDDTKRPTLPMTESMDDSTTVGVALDLSSKDRVYKPIPLDEELEESPGPLPGLWVLTHEGILCSWWVVYAESIYARTVYPGLAIAANAAASNTVQPPAPAPPSTPKASFSSNAPPAFGSSTSGAAPAFGSATSLGQKLSPWATASIAATPAQPTAGATFGSSILGSSTASNSTFGKPSTIGLGQSSQLGMRTSPWGSGGGSGPVFGQAGFSGLASGGGNAQTPFASHSTPSAPSSGGFAGFSNQGGFSAVAANSATGSVFGSGSKTLGPSFGSGSGPEASMDTAFPPRKTGSSSEPFSSTVPFKLVSSFKPDASQSEPEGKSATAAGSVMFDGSFGKALNENGSQAGSIANTMNDEDMDTAGSAEDLSPVAHQQPPLPAAESQKSTTPESTPTPSRFGPPPVSSETEVSPPSRLSRIGGPGGLFGMGAKEAYKPAAPSPLSLQTEPAADGVAPNSPSVPRTPKVKFGGEVEPIPPDTTSKASFMAGDSSSSSATSKNASQNQATATTPSKSDPSPGFLAARELAGTSPTGPPTHDGVKGEATRTWRGSTRPETVALQESSNDLSSAPSDLDSKGDDEESASEGIGSDDEFEGGDVEDDVSEGSGIDVAQELSLGADGQASRTPPRSSRGFQESATSSSPKTGQEKTRPLFGDVGQNAAALFPPGATSPQSPSPVQRAIPSRIMRADASRSISAPGMTRQTSKSVPQLQSKKGQAKAVVESYMSRGRRAAARREAEECQPLVDEEDDQIQRVLESEVEGVLELDEFIARTNVMVTGEENVPSQVEAVYRDINAMIDTLGLNSRAVKAFVKGHREKRKEGGRGKDDLELADDWVICEVSELGEVLEKELGEELEEGRVRDLDEKLDACRELAREVQRLRVKQQDIKKAVMARLDPKEAEAARSLPLNAEQAAQQNELRREFAKLVRHLSQVEEALTMLKTKMASMAGSSGRGAIKVPTVEAIMRTITKMTSMAEKRSGDVDVLETQLRRLRLQSTSRECSPMTMPPAKGSITASTMATTTTMTTTTAAAAAAAAALLTPSRPGPMSLSGSFASPGSAARRTPPRKKLSGFSREEKGDLMEKRAGREAILTKLQDNMEKRGVTVWSVEDFE